MNDKELLVAAARAAGLTRVTISETPALGLHAWAKSLFDECGSGVWNPLTDDGDEARLEAALQLHVEWHPLQNKVTVGTAELRRTEFYGQDRQAARRRAGVRAAAALDSGHNADVCGLPHGKESK